MALRHAVTEFLNTQPAVFSGDGLDPFAEFRVQQPREIAGLLKQLVDGGVPVNLSAPDGASVTTVLWTQDTAQRRLSFSAESLTPQLQRVADADEATAVGYLESVKLQFDLRDLMLVHGPRMVALQAAMPTTLYRFQRRNAYRVRTLDRTAPTAHLRHPSLPDMQLALRVLDVSIGGCALLLPHDVPEMQPGVRIAGVRIELDPDTRFQATLLLHHVTSTGASSRGVRLGCELVHIDGAASRALQRYIDHTQKRRRLLTLD